MIKLKKKKKKLNYLLAVGTLLIVCVMLVLSGCLSTKQIKESDVNWTYAIPWNPKKIQIVDDMVFVQTDFNFHVINAKDGKLRWRFGEGARYIEAAQWDKKSVYLAAYDDKTELTNLLVSIDIQTGRDNWAISTKEEIEAMVSDSKALYVTGTKGSLYKIEKTTGKINKQTDSLDIGLQSQKRTNKGKEDFNKFKHLAKSLRYLNTVKGVIYAAKEGKPYGKPTDNVVYAIDQKTGQEKWSFRFPSGEYAAGLGGYKVWPTIVSDDLTLLGLWDLGDEGYGAVNIYAIKQ